MSGALNPTCNFDNLQLPKLGLLIRGRNELGGAIIPKL